MEMDILYKNIISLNDDENELLEKIKFQYGKEEKAILYIKPIIKDISIDFLLILPRKGVFIISLISWNHNDLQYMNNMVGEIGGKGIKNPFFSAKQSFNFVKSSFETISTLLDESGKLIFKFQIISIFSHMEKEEILKIPNSFPNENHFAVSISEFSNLFLEKIDLDEIEKEEKVMTDETIKAVRYTLFPEIRLPQEKTMEEISEKNIVSEMIKVLDREQEKIAHSPCEGIQIVRGVPGSGKTVILISRAIYLAKLYPDAKIKILSFTRTLKSIIKNKLESMEEALLFQGISLENISVDTFHTLALELTKTAEEKLILSSENIFWKEILPKLALEKAHELYDYILIDEYQDFHSQWIEVCLKTLRDGKDGKKHLFLTGDPMQSIYDTPKYNLKKIQDSEKNQIVLKNSYRTGKRQMELAISFIEKDPNFKNDIVESYLNLEDIKTQNIHNSGMFFLENGYREVRELLQTLIFEKSYQPEEILILAPKKSVCEGFYAFLPEELQDKIIISKNIQNKRSILTTYHSAKGIESKICILLNFDNIDNKKLAYVAVTRAHEQTYIHSENIGTQNFANDFYRLSNI